jgi:histidyl-tRNA synthetase
MAVQRYIFDVWSKTAESFGYERYDASVLEPSDLYKAKGAENEELVNEQTYTFTDRGDREVTLRPEMTPTVARMVAGRRRELSFPVRWYSIPNLFRYERPQRGRLREHWQLNCDMFGATDYTADVEIIALAHAIIKNFGANDTMFEIRINNKELAQETIKKIASEEGEYLDEEQIKKVIRLMDREAKLSAVEYLDQMSKIVPRDVANSLCETTLEEVSKLMENVPSYQNLIEIGKGLASLGIVTKLDSHLVRGFDYYTGTIFEIFDVSGQNNRAMLGGGRYDNLTEMFGGEPISGIGFGMGDVTMRDFLETHNLLNANSTAPTLMIIPTDPTQNLEAQKIAQQFRHNADIAVAVDISTKKIGKKISDASEKMVEYVLVVGEDEVRDNQYTLKHLHEDNKKTGDITTLVAHFRD